MAEERRRIARELHDLAGHTLAAVLLHVTGARHVLRRDVDEAERALVDAETVGRASLDQIRATVAALRTDERGTDPALAGSADLVALVEEYRRAGLAIETDVAPAAPDIDGPAGTALHRIAREALANVARHAPRTRRRLAVQRDDAAGCGSPSPTTARAPAGPRRRRPLRLHRHARARPRAGRPSSTPGPTTDGWAVEAACHRSLATQRGAVVIRVLIVDDQPVVRAGVARILGPDDGFEVVAECDDGDEVLDAVAAHRPDLVLMDVRMRRVDGVTATRQLRARGDDPPVLVLTTFDDDDALWGALDAGAAGFVLKDAVAEDLIAAARAVAGGAAWLDPKVAPRVLHAARGARRGAPASARRARRAHRTGARRPPPHGPGGHQRGDRRRR